MKRAVSTQSQSASRMTRLKLLTAATAAAPVIASSPTAPRVPPLHISGQQLDHTRAAVRMASSAADIDAWTGPELKAELRQRGLPVSGVKASLIARLAPQLTAGDQPDPANEQPSLSAASPAATDEPSPTATAERTAADAAGRAGAKVQPAAKVKAAETAPTAQKRRERSSTDAPALDAGRALAVALGVDPNTVTVLPRDRSVDGTEIASVQSPPLMQRLRDMMNFSDNVMAESIGREVAVALSRPASFDGAARSVLATLDDAGIDTSGARLFDSSGLSVDDRLTALTLDEIVTAAVGDSAPALRPLVDLVPIAGGSGTLSNRYLDTAAAGYLRGKTGSLTGTNTLTGFVTDKSGRVLTFALMSNDAGPTGRTALDAFAATLRSCGCAA